MSWKKNKISYLMWLIYTLFTAGVLLTTTEVLAERFLEGVPLGGLILWLGIVVATGAVVFVVRRGIGRKQSAVQENVSPRLFREALVAVLLLILGLILRLDGMSGQGELATYYETARVAEGQTVPAVVHGASYLYLQLLHILFLFFGNKFVAAVWMQIVLQMIAALLLFFSVRKLAGPVAALVSFGFFMCADHMIKGAVTLSPQSLYLLIFALGLVALAACQGRKLHTGIFLGVGILIGLACYLDVAGLLLLFILAICATGERAETTEIKDKLIALCFGVIGALVAFWGAMEADAFISGKSFGNVVNAWLKLYDSQNLQLSVPQVSENFNWWSVVLVVFLTAGIFSFWCDRQNERMGMWVFSVCAAWVMNCLGMFTEELPVSSYMFLFLTVLAGLGVGEIFRKPVAQEDTTSSEENSEDEPDAGEEAVPLEQVKLPKYLREPGADQAKIPRYMREEEEERKRTAAAAAAPAPVAAPSGEPVPEEPAVSEPVAVEPTADQPVDQTIEAEETETVVVSGYAEPEEDENPAGTFRRLGETAMPVAAVAAGESGTEDAEETRTETTQSAVEAPGTEEPILAEESKAEEPAAEDTGDEKPKATKFIENPLPLPKPHVKKIMGYDRKPIVGEDDFDHPVRDDDDFDI